MRKFRHPAKAGLSPFKGETGFGISQTVPNQVLSMRDIFKKFSSGQSIDDINRDVEFTEDMQDIRGLDIVELHNLRLDVRQEIQDIEAEMVRRQNEERLKRDEEQRLFNDFIRSKQDEQNPNPNPNPN